MGVINCPRCQQRVIFNEHTEDIDHQCNSGNKTLDEEDIVVIGDWSDYTGSGIGNNPFTQGAENTLFGTRADLEGERNQDTTRRGVRASTRRQRKHIQHIILEGGD